MTGFVFHGAGHIEGRMEMLFESLTEDYPDIRDFFRDAVSVVMGVFDSDGRLLCANTGMNRLLGVDENGKPVCQFVNPDFGTLFNHPEQNDPVFEGRLTAGNRMDVSQTVIAKAYRRNGVLLIVGEYDVMEMEVLNRRMLELNREIGQVQRELIKEKQMLKKTLAELEETQSMLIHSEKMNALGRLVAGIAHEINNPIAFVRSNMYSLMESFEDVRDAYGLLEKLIETACPDSLAEAESIRESHDIGFIFDDFNGMHRAITDGVSRVQTLVTDLRTFSRLDESEIKEIDIEESVKSALALCLPELRKRNVTVVLDVNALPPVSCHAAEINQVFLNLIINATQAMENGGTLKIKGKTENGNVCLEFSDTGVGIPENIISQIFNPFFTTKPPGSGTGLGLSLSYKIIVEKHNGAISVDSKPNQGAVFKITLPVETK